MSALLARIADQVLNRPLLVTPDKAQIILAVLGGRIGIGEPGVNRFEGSDVERDTTGRVVKLKPYRVANSVAIVTITGSLVNRGAWVGANSGLTSYEGIQHQLKTAAADPAVKAVILDMHTPGGQAVGSFETAAMVRDVAAKKPVVALVAGMAASAGYAIASGATEIVTTESGISGSIGVLLLHADFSRQLDKDGITPTLIIAGARKADGNPFQPLSDDVRSRLQGEVDAIYDLFLKAVAQGRGKRFDAAAARATEARVFMGVDAVKVGLADRVGTFESVLAELTESKGNFPAPVVPSGAPAGTANRSRSPVASMVEASIASAIAEAMAKPVAQAEMAKDADPVTAGLRREYEASAALRAVWPTFETYAAAFAARRAAFSGKTF
jgi:signal peptide peptidase SppA